MATVIEILYRKRRSVLLLRLANYGNKEEKNQFIEGGTEAGFFRGAV
jgi:hypothetical protein